MSVQLYEYQKKYLADLEPRAIMAADTGTGKTFMALAHYQRHCTREVEKLNEGGNWRNKDDYKKVIYSVPLLILAPASKVRTGDWEREITEWFGTGNKPEYQIYSYEKFSRDPSLAQYKKGKRAVWQQFVESYGGVQHAVICDEVHRAKNPQSGIGKRVFLATKSAQFFVGLSATPLPNGWIDFANYSKIFGYVKNITHFKNKYCHIETYKGFPEIVGYWHEDELTAQWKSISNLLTKAQANDLPARTFIGVGFKRPKKYLSTIVERKNDEGVLLDTAPALAHALRQTLIAPKLDYLKDLLVGTTENVVIFYNYISEREALLELLQKPDLSKKTIFRQDGEKHELPKKEDWSKIFNSVTLSQYKSGSTGVEMTYATQVVYFSPTYSYADYLQSIGRVYRNGQISKTTFYNFRTPNTIEADIYDTLKGKNDFQASQWLTKLEQKEAK